MDELLHIQEWILANGRIFHLLKKHQEINVALKHPYFADASINVNTAHLAMFHGVHWTSV